MNSAIFGLLIDWPMFFFFFDWPKSLKAELIKELSLGSVQIIVLWSIESSICFSDVLFQQFWDKIHLIKIEKEAIEDLTIVWTYGL